MKNKNSIFGLNLKRILLLIGIFVFITVIRYTTSVSYKCSGDVCLGPYFREGDILFFVINLLLSYFLIVFISFLHQKITKSKHGN